MSYPTLVASKAARIAHAAGDTAVVDFGLRKAHGIDGGVTAARAAYLGGCSATANVLAGKDCVTEVPAERWDPELYYAPDGDGERTPSRWGGFLPEIPFDPLSFGIPPASLASIEPVQLLALEAARRARPDLVLLGNPLPDASAVDLCDRIRSRDRGLPVIVLDAGGADPVDRVRAFDRGCDDWLARPFDYEELLARIRAVLRRASPEPAEVLAAGAIAVDRGTRRATVAGIPVPLAGKEFELSRNQMIVGRTDDLIIIRGVNVYPSAVEAIVRTFPVEEFRLVRTRTGALDELTVEVETRSEAIAEALGRELRQRLAVRIPTRAVPVGTLPRWELKARRLVDARDGGETAR